MPPVLHPPLPGTVLPCRRCRFWTRNSEVTIMSLVVEVFLVFKSCLDFCIFSPLIWSKEVVVRYLLCWIEIWIDPRVIPLSLPYCYPFMCHNWQWTHTNSFLNGCLQCLASICNIFRRLLVDVSWQFKDVSSMLVLYFYWVLNFISCLFLAFVEMISPPPPFSLVS